MRFVAFCLLAVLTVPSTSLAQEADAPTPEQVNQARSLYEQGAQAFERHRWLECAQSFERSFTIVFSPELLYNIGRCYEEAARLSRNRDHYSRALAAYQRYVREVEDADREEIALKVEQLRGELELLPPEVDPDPEPPQEITPEPEVVQEETPDPILEVQPPAAESEYAWTWTTVGVAATALTAVAAVVLGVVANVEYDSLLNTCAPDCRPGDVDRVEGMIAATNALLVVSGVFLVGTGVVFTLEFVDQDRGAPIPSAFGVSYTRSF